MNSVFNNAFNMIWALMIILSLAGLIYLSGSIVVLIIVAAALIFFRYKDSYSITREKDTQAGTGKKSGKFAAMIPALKKTWFLMIALGILYIFFTFYTAGRPSEPWHDRMYSSYENIGISYGSKKVPEGTAYVDILVKLDSSDKDYTEFNAVPQPLTYRYDGMLLTDGDPLDIDENSEIAKYNEDGYMSLSLHSADVWFFDLNENENDHLMLHCNFHDLYKKYGRFKLAYVGEHGEVLGVTKKASHRYSTSKGEAVIANGDKAAYREKIDDSYVKNAANTIVFYNLAVTVIVMILSIFKLMIQKISWDSWVREQTRKKRG